MIPITTSFIMCSIIQLFCFCFNKPSGLYFAPKSANCSLLRLIYRFSQLWNSGTQPPKAITLEGTNISEGIFEDDFPLVWMGYVRSQEGTHLHIAIPVHHISSLEITAPDQSNQLLWHFNDLFIDLVFLFHHFLTHMC